MSRIKADVQFTFERAGNKLDPKTCKIVPGDKEQVATLRGCKYSAKRNSPGRSEHEVIDFVKAFKGIICQKHNGVVQLQKSHGIQDDDVAYLTDSQGNKVGCGKYVVSGVCLKEMRKTYHIEFYLTECG